MKLFLLLSSLSKEELKILRKAVLSPLYNSNKKVVQLFELLRPKHPTFDASQKVKEKLYKKLFTAEGFNDYKWRRVCSELTKVVEQVLIYIDTMDNDFARQKQLKRIYNKRGLYPLFKKYTSDLLAQLEAEPIRSAELHREKMDLLSKQYFHHTHDKYDLQDETLEQAMEALDTYFALQKMRYTIAFKGKQQVIKNNNTQILFLEAIEKEQQQGFQSNNVLLELYLQAMDFSEETSFEDFERYERIFFSKIKKFDEFDQKVLFIAGVNFVIKQGKRGYSEYKNYLFKWYKFGEANNLLLVQNKITEPIFANIIINGCQVKEFDWVESFINRYKNYLNVDKLEDTLLYYRGIIYYAKGDWDKSLDYLLTGTKKRVYPLRSRSVIVRAFFEKYLEDDSYLELLLANIQAFEVYLRRDTTFVEETIIHYLNFLRISKLLARKIHANESPQSIKDWLYDKTRSDKSILAKSWLIEKVNEL